MDIGHFRREYLKIPRVIYQISIFSFQVAISNMTDMLQIELCTDKVNLALIFHIPHRSLDQVIPPDI